MAPTTTDRPAGTTGPEHLARWIAGPQWTLLDSWPRVVEMLTRASLHAQRAIFDLNARTLDVLVDPDRSTLLAWAETTERTQQAALDLWQSLMRESARVADATTTELQHSAVHLLDALDQERTMRDRVEQQRQREHARAEREHADRQTVERERDEQKRRADDEHRARQQAERAVERLERELAQERERAAAASDQAQSSNQPPAVNVIHREEDWAVVREDAKRASGVFSTKREALQRAKEIARRDGAEVQVQPDGEGPGARS